MSDGQKTANSRHSYQVWAQALVIIILISVWLHNTYIILWSLDLESTLRFFKASAQGDEPNSILKGFHEVRSPIKNSQTIFSRPYIC